MDTARVTLGEFGADRVWYASTGSPTGETIDLFWTDEEAGERIEMDAFDLEAALPFPWTLEGTVNESGEWTWDGEGDPKDCRFNAVTRIKAFR